MRGTPDNYTQLPKRIRRRLAMRSLLRSLLVSVVIVAGYFLLPMDHLDGDVSLALAGGLAVVALLLAWQIRDIAGSPYPRIRAIGTLATSLPLFLAIFATTYFLLARNDPANFSQSLSRLDSAYFTVTVFSTVGFGDIVPVSEVARLVTMVQMFGDLLIVGLVARVLFGAVQHNLSQREE